LNAYDRARLALAFTLFFATSSVKLGLSKRRRRVLFRRRSTRLRLVGGGPILLIVNHFQGPVVVVVVVIVACKILFPQRLMIFLPLEHFFGHFDGEANVAGGSAVASVVVIVVEADVGGGTGDIARRCVLCLSDGVLDEPGSDDFVDCELACAD